MSGASANAVAAFCRSRIPPQLQKRCLLFPLPSFPIKVAICDIAGADSSSNDSSNSSRECSSDCSSQSSSNCKSTRSSICKSNSSRKRSSASSSTGSTSSSTASTCSSNGNSDRSNHRSSKCSSTCKSKSSSNFSNDMDSRISVYDMGRKSYHLITCAASNSDSSMPLSLVKNSKLGSRVVPSHSVSLSTTICRRDKDSRGVPSRSNVPSSNTGNVYSNNSGCSSCSSSTYYYYDYYYRFHWRSFSAILPALYQGGSKQGSRSNIRSSERCTSWNSRGGCPVRVSQPQAVASFVERENRRQETKKQQAAVAAAAKLVSLLARRSGAAAGATAAPPAQPGEHRILRATAIAETERSATAAADAAREGTTAGDTPAAAPRTRRCLYVTRKGSEKVTTVREGEEVATGVSGAVGGSKLGTAEQKRRELRLLNITFTEALASAPSAAAVFRLVLQHRRLLMPCNAITALHVLASRHQQHTAAPRSKRAAAAAADGSIRLPLLLHPCMPLLLRRLIAINRSPLQQLFPTAAVATSSPLTSDAPSSYPPVVPSPTAVHCPAAATQPSVAVKPLAATATRPVAAADVPAAGSGANVSEHTAPSSLAAASLDAVSPTVAAAATYNSLRKRESSSLRHCSSNSSNISINRSRTCSTKGCSSTDCSSMHTDTETESRQLQATLRASIGNRHLPLVIWSLAKLLLAAEPFFETRSSRRHSLASLSCIPPTSTPTAVCSSLAPTCTPVAAIRPLTMAVTTGIAASVAASTVVPLAAASAAPLPAASVGLVTTPAGAAFAAVGTSVAAGPITAAPIVDGAAPIITVAPITADGAHVAAASPVADAASEPVPPPAVRQSKKQTAPVEFPSLALLLQPHRQQQEISQEKHSEYSLHLQQQHHEVAANSQISKPYASVTSIATAATKALLLRTAKNYGADCAPDATGRQQQQQQEKECYQREEQDVLQLLRLCLDAAAAAVGTRAAGLGTMALSTTAWSLAVANVALHALSLPETAVVRIKQYNDEEEQQEERTHKQLVDVLQGPSSVQQECSQQSLLQQQTYPPRAQKKLQQAQQTYSERQLGSGYKLEQHNAGAADNTTEKDYNRSRCTRSSGASSSIINISSSETSSTNSSSDTSKSNNSSCTRDSVSSSTSTSSGITTSSSSSSRGRTHKSSTEEVRVSPSISSIFAATATASDAAMQHCSSVNSCRHRNITTKKHFTNKREAKHFLSSFSSLTSSLTSPIPFSFSSPTSRDLLQRAMAAIGRRLLDLSQMQDSRFTATALDASSCTIAAAGLRAWQRRIDEKVKLLEIGLFHAHNKELKNKKQPQQQTPEEVALSTPQQQQQKAPQQHAEQQQQTVESNQHLLQSQQQLQWQQHSQHREKLQRQSYQQQQQLQHQPEVLQRQELEQSQPLPQQQRAWQQGLQGQQQRSSAALVDNARRPEETEADVWQRRGWVARRKNDKPGKSQGRHQSSSLPEQQSTDERDERPQQQVYLRHSTKRKSDWSSNYCRSRDVCIYTWACARLRLPVAQILMPLLYYSFGGRMAAATAAAIGCDKEAAAMRWREATGGTRVAAASTAELAKEAYYRKRNGIEDTTIAAKGRTETGGTVREETLTVSTTALYVTPTAAIDSTITAGTRSAAPSKETAAGDTISTGTSKEEAGAAAAAGAPRPTAAAEAVSNAKHREEVECFDAARCRAAETNVARTLEERKTESQPITEKTATPLSACGPQDIAYLAHALGVFQYGKRRSNSDYAALNRQTKKKKQQDVQQHLPPQSLRNQQRIESNGVLMLKTHMEQHREREEAPPQQYRRLHRQYATDHLHSEVCLLQGDETMLQQTRQCESTQQQQQYLGAETPGGDMWERQQQHESQGKSTQQLPQQPVLLNMQERFVIYELPLLLVERATELLPFLSLMQLIDVLWGLARLASCSARRCERSIATEQHQQHQQMLGQQASARTRPHGHGRQLLPEYQMREKEQEIQRQRRKPESDDEGIPVQKMEQLHPEQGQQQPQQQQSQQQQSQQQQSQQQQSQQRQPQQQQPQQRQPQQRQPKQQHLQEQHQIQRQQRQQQHRTQRRRQQQHPKIASKNKILSSPREQKKCGASQLEKQRLYTFFKTQEQSEEECWGAQEQHPGEQHRLQTLQLQGDSLNLFVRNPMPYKERKTDTTAARSEKHEAEEQQSVQQAKPGSTEVKASKMYTLPCVTAHGPIAAASVTSTDSCRPDAADCNASAAAALVAAVPQYFVLAEQQLCKLLLPAIAAAISQRHPRQLHHNCTNSDAINRGRSIKKDREAATTAVEAGDGKQEMDEVQSQRGYDAGVLVGGRRSTSAIPEVTACAGALPAEAATAAALRDAAVAAAVNSTAATAAAHAEAAADAIVTAGATVAAVDTAAAADASASIDAAETSIPPAEAGRLTAQPSAYATTGENTGISQAAAIPGAVGSEREKDRTGEIVATSGRTGQLSERLRRRLLEAYFLLNRDIPNSVAFLLQTRF